MFLIPRKHRQVLGLDITSSSIKLIELSLSGGQYVVDSYAAEPTPQNSMNEKAIVDAESEQILGAAVLGIEGGEIASQIQIAMMGKLPYTALRDGIFPHPGLAEALNNLFADGFQDG